MPVKRISLEAFIRRYSEANQSPDDVLSAAVNKLKQDSEAYRLAKDAHAAKQAFEEYLTGAGFEW